MDETLQRIKIVVEQHEDGFIAYPLGIEGGCAGEGDTFEQALKDAQSALQFHVDTFGVEVLLEPPT